MNPFTGFCALVFALLTPVITIAGLVVLAGFTGLTGLWIGVAGLIVGGWWLRRGKP